MILKLNTILILAVSISCHLSSDDGYEIQSTFVVDAFSVSTSPFSNRTRRSSSNTSNTKIKGVHSNNEEEKDHGDDVTQLRNEIDEMRKEALQKLNELDIRASSNTSSLSSSRVIEEQQIEMSVNDGANADTSSTSLNTRTATATATNLAETPEEENIADVEIENDRNSRALMEEISFDDDGIPQSSSAMRRDYLSSSPVSRNVLSLLDNSVWKISMNIGREPGTWMPQDWGVSGERLILNLEIKFTDEQLYEREEFLGSMGGAKILSIQNDELIISPTLTQGRRVVNVVNSGGWRIVRGGGPMDTDLLRFYIDIGENELRNDGSDVYCPKGRVYMNCGYFPRKNAGIESAQYGSRRKQLKNQLDKMISRAEELDDEIAAEGPFSINKIKKSAELFRLKVDMQKTGEMLMSASIVEPNDSVLKMSLDKSVGLTREGGMCCKVQKGLSIEYHILGRFNIAPSRVQSTGNEEY